MNGIHKVKPGRPPPIFSQPPSLPLFLPLPSTTPSPATTTSSKMPAPVFRLAFLTILLCLRSADAQSSSSSSPPSSSTASLPAPSVSLLSVNPTAVPLSQIISTESPAPTPSLPSTPASGTVPTFLPNAPPLPSRKHMNAKF